MTDVNVELSHALVQAVAGEYPDSEAILSTEVLPGALHTAIQAINQERERIQAEVRQISREVAPDVDGWIHQAKQLQADIEKSKATAREIVQQAEQARLLRQKREEVGKKSSLLDQEVNFTRKLENVLGNIQKVTKTLGDGHSEMIQGRLETALNKFLSVQALLAELRPLEQTTVVELLLQRTEKLRSSLGEEIQRQWDASICVDRVNSKVVFRQLSEDRDHPPNMSMDVIADLSSQLDLLQTSVARSCREITSTIVRPLLEPTSASQVARLSYDDKEMYISGHATNPGAPAIIDDITAFVEFLNNNLSSMTSVAVSECLMPPVVSRLVSHWLMPSIPTSVEAVGEFNILLEHTETLIASLRRIGWAGSADLDEWVQQGPRNWLARRRESSLATTRTTLANNVQHTKSVERVETQVVVKGDMLDAQRGNSDDWDAGWSDEDNLKSPSKASHHSAEEEDDSAWGGAEDTAETRHDTEAHLADTMHNEDDEGNAWGWSEQDGNSVPPSPVKTRKEPPKANGAQPYSKPAERSMTLREHYTITDVPDQLRDMIAQISHDADTLRRPEFEDSPMAAAAAALYSLPTLIVACFRALAPTYYSPLVGSNMYLYNDSQRLASELERFAAQQAAEDATTPLSQSAWPSTRMKLHVDILALEKFGKRAYGKEMESQRTILRDLLDGAQGFINCTDVPFAAECDNAVAMTIDRIRDVCKQWTPILSRSALLQSLGSLLTTVTSKMLDDAQNLPDISEAESQRLRHFFTEVSKLSDLFAQPNPADASDAKDMTPLYTPNWFKFQYLSEIMDSSLADIKYLWTDADLKLEFGAEEVVDLIEALFADTDRRRKAIADIRSG